MQNSGINHYDLLLATAAQSREIDRLTIEELGLPGETLMEIAGSRAADLLKEKLIPGDSVLFVCGKGNNAGDAFVIARLLTDYGIHAAIYPVMGTDGFSDDAQKNYDRLLKLAGISGKKIAVWQDWQDPSGFDLIVDGIFGTGIDKEVRQPVSDIIGKMNRSGIPVCALDIPSGIHCDTGRTLGTAVRAETTIQFGLNKLGCYLGDGPDCAGTRVLASLPFPNRYKHSVSVRLAEMNREATEALLHTPPSRRSHKYNNGVVHVIGGSPGLTGAPAYTARAAWTLGLGAVSLIHPAGWQTAATLETPSIIRYPAGGDTDHHFTPDHIEQVLNTLREKPGVAVIGPGIGRNEGTMAFCREIIRRSEGPLVIDADALRCLAGAGALLKERSEKGPVVLTPHPGELKALTDTGSGDDSDRLRAAISYSESTGATVLAKGNPVIVHSAEEKKTILTPYDSTIFARAGFGDILAGNLAAFLSRTSQPSRGSEAALVYGYHKWNEIVSRGKPFPEPSDFT
ncbi:NAD(P)H-hydrate dehydratase [Natronogracilivirga saccharolytica]|nr:NAD(P)H-hydrate dehydratase [Natronogracilivirga saccharolytica]